MKLTKRETATVLAALRSWAEELEFHSSVAREQRQHARCKRHEHFYKCAPLAAEEVHELCEKINLGDA